MIKKIVNNALSLGACDLVKKPTNWAEIVDLLFSPQGVEFCMEHDFPSLKMWREVPKDKLAELGVFIDAGEILIKDTHNIAIIGETTANIVCDKCDRVYKIIAMHRAVVKVEALNYSVTRIYKGVTCTVDTYNDGTAKILK